jgi:hypothetical protein
MQMSWYQEINFNLDLTCPTVETRMSNLDLHKSTL